MRIRLLVLILCATLLEGIKAQTGPEIDVLTPNPCVPEQVSLRVINCSSCISYEWEIGTGKGYKRAGSNYSTIITDTGWFDVNVKITTASNSTVFISKKKAFYGRPSPNIEFTVSQPVLCNGADSILLTDVTAGSKSRDWFVDGKIFYNGPKTLKLGLTSTLGYRSVYLLVRDSFNCKAAKLKDSAISVWDSVKATVTTSLTGKCAPTSVNFIASLDTGKQKISSRLWKFEKGLPATSTAANPTGIAYSKGDTLDTWLTLNTDRGCTYRYKFNNLLNIGDTSLLSIKVSKVKICANEPLQLTVSGAKSSNPKWTVDSVKTNEGVQTGTTVTYSFKDTGNPLIKVQENVKGCISYATFTTKVVIEGPVARFVSESPFYCGTPKTLTFTNKSDEWPGGTTWKWMLWDSKGTLVTSSTSKAFSYTASSGETYAVQLKATGTNGCSDSTYAKKAAVFGHIDTNFIVDPSPSCPGKSITLKSVAGAGSPSDPNTFLWSVYDNSGNKIFTDNKANPSFTFNKAGNYSAKMVVSNNSNCKDSVFLHDTIHVIAPSLSIKFDDSYMCVNRKIELTAVYNFRSPSAYLFWTMQNIDSANSPLNTNRDTARFYPYQTGRYKIAVQMMDTAKNACAFSYAYPGLIYVSGIKAKVTPPESMGCAPLNVNLSATVTQNVSYKVKSNAINYTWKSLATTGLTFSNPNAMSTTATAATEAQHWPYFRYENASGCADSAYAVVDTRFQASFYVSNVAHCVGTTGTIVNQATSWATEYEYVADTSVKFSPSNKVPNPSIKFTKAGTWRIDQIIKSGNCRDTFYNYFVISEVKADFYTPDSISYCAPRLINYINNTNSTFTNYWKFGDGDSAVSMFNDMTGHLYLKNNSRPGFDVTLVAVNEYGCRDTITKKGYLRLIGPVPDFEAFNTTGCESLRVTFKNKSYDYSRMLMDYDNGVVKDSMELGSYDYVVTNKALPVQQYFPRLLLIDTLGCSAMAVCPDTINVYKGPEAKFAFTSVKFIRNNEGCAGQLLVKFSNQSKFFGKTYWDFDADNITDIKNQNAPSYLYNKPGVFYPRLIAEHVNGCKDTFTKDAITVWETPVADFKATDTTCAVNPVQFTYTGSSGNPIVKYNWNFGELPIYSDTSTKKDPLWKYSTPFNHNVTLDVEDSKGCRSQVVKNEFVNDTAGPKKPELAYVTVKDDKYVEFYWKQSKIGNFLEYHVLLDSLGLWDKGTKNKRQDTMFSANYMSQLSNRRFCYTMRIEDTCNQRGIPANSHCTIVLRDSAFEPFNIHLKWLGYDFWGSELDHYEIFRKTGSGNYVKIADIKPGKLTYTDSFLCDKDYCYYVEAVHKNREYRSRSNTTCKRPIYLKPDSSVKTTLVTVVDNAYPQIAWEPYYKYYRNWSYVLERSSNGMAGSFSKVQEVHGLDTMDLGTNVQDRANFYRISFKDHCGVKGEPGLVSNTVWLKAEKKDRNNSSLTWTPYDYWYSGVRNYGVQLRNSAGQFEDMTVVSGGTTSVDNIDIEKLNLDSICFRVYAVKDTLTSDTSWSNEVCLVPASYVHVPTAFTPDANNLNDVFKPVSAFLHKEAENTSTRYEFKIYNRWGQMVFFTNDPKQGWNGTFQDTQCESGLYVWKLQAVGYDGVAYRMDGTVYLLR